MSSREIIFYDGDCGLCQRWVRAVLAADPDGTHFDFATRHGRTFEQVLSPEDRAALPESVVVLRRDGTILTRSRAVRHICTKLGGKFAVPAVLLGVMPRGLADWGYRQIARFRRRLAPPPAEGCPIAPPGQQARFLP